LPIMQHFLFGTILPFAGSGVYSQGDAPCADGHLHVTAFGQLAPDCCGIKVPSAIAAAAAAGASTTTAAGKREAIAQFRAPPRPLPFD
ncbi:hypothetical protein CXG81DRAFT_28113, partial [Caulochytrium protostelioides]